MPTKRTTKRQGPPGFIVQSLDPFLLASGIAIGLWPRDYNLTSTQWQRIERRAAPLWKVIEKAARNRSALPDLRFSVVDTYPRALVRLAFLPEALRGKVLGEIAGIVEHAIESGEIPRPPAWRERKRRKRRALHLGDGEEQRLLLRIASLDADGLNTAEIAKELWPGSHPRDARNLRKLRVRHYRSIARRERARLVLEK